MQAADFWVHKKTSQLCSVIINIGWIDSSIHLFQFATVATSRMDAYTFFTLRKKQYYIPFKNLNKITSHNLFKSIILVYILGIVLLEVPKCNPKRHWHWKSI